MPRPPRSSAADWPLDNHTLERLARVLHAPISALFDGGRASDDWMDEFIAVGETIPEVRRTLALAILRRIAAQPAGR